MTTNNIVRKGFYLTPDQVEALRKLSYEKRLPESEIIRQALDQYMSGRPGQFSLSDKVLSAANKLAEEKQVTLSKVIEAALERQIPERYFKGGEV